MIVLGNDRLNLIVVRGKQPAVFVRAGRTVLVLGFQVRQIPDAILHSSWVIVDERDLFRWIQLGEPSHPRPYKKTEIFVLLPSYVRIQEWRVGRIVESSQKVGI